MLRIIETLLNCLGEGTTTPNYMESDTINPEFCVSSKLPLSILRVLVSWYYVSKV